MAESRSIGIAAVNDTVIAQPPLSFVALESLFASIL
jgi:hypothetical protein